MAGDNAVRLTDGGPERWANAAGWYCEQSSPVITGLSQEQADRLVEKHDYFEHVEGDVRDSEVGSEVTSDADSDADSSGSADDESSASEADESDSDESGDVESPLDPSKYTVSDLEDELDGSDYSDAELDALESAEKDDENRSGAVEAITDAKGE